MADIESLGEQAGMPPEASETTAAYLHRLNTELALGLEAEIDTVVAALEKQRFAPESPTDTEQAALTCFEQELRAAVDNIETAPETNPEPTSAETVSAGQHTPAPATPSSIQRGLTIFRARFPTRSEQFLVVGLALVALFIVVGAAGGGVLTTTETLSELGGTTQGSSENTTATPTPAEERDTLDNDGLNATRERLIGTDPTVADTDADGLDDRQEANGRTDPLVNDTDGDGLLDGREVKLGTNPVSADTDGDGLSDSVEVAGPTDPRKVDTDGDGLDDPQELDGPTSPTAADTDGDGLDDRQELNGPTLPTVADTDEDGLQDGAELAEGTDPTIADTDGDQLLDGWEVQEETPNGAPLPDADPLHKDLYVLISRGSESYALQERERAQVRGAFKYMPVANPDGTEGITVHLVDGETLSLRRTFTDKRTAEQALAANSTEAVLGARAGVYHHVILMRISEDADFDGAAATPGRTVLVDEDERSPRDGTLPYRNRLIVRGLLQNIIGQPAPEHRADSNADLTTEGWTAHEPERELRFHEYLPDYLVEKLEAEGFAA